MVDQQVKNDVHGAWDALLMFLWVVACFTAGIAGVMLALRALYLLWVFLFPHAYWPRTSP